MSDFDTIILRRLYEGMDLNSILTELHISAGLWTAIMDVEHKTGFRAPDSLEHVQDLDGLIRNLIDSFRAGDTPAIKLLRDGVPMVYEAPRDGGRTYVCGLASKRGQARNIISLGLPPLMSAEKGLELLERLCQVYEYLSRKTALDSPARAANYLEMGLARELIFGEGDVSKNIFGDLHELRLNGHSRGIEPGYLMAVLQPLSRESERRLAEQSASLTKILPQSFHMSDGGKIYIFCYGTGDMGLGGIYGKLEYFCALNRMSCAVSHIFYSLDDRGGYRRQAEQLLKLSLGERRQGLIRAEQKYLEIIVSGAVERVGHKVLELSETALLADYDRKNNTEYLSTLEAYLDYGNHLSPAAASMFIDRSTMKYRLQKISDLLDVDIEDADTAKRLALGIAVHRQK